MGLNKTYFNFGGNLHFSLWTTDCINILFPPFSERICYFPHVTTSLQTPHYTEIW